MNAPWITSIVTEEECLYKRSGYAIDPVFGDDGDGLSRYAFRRNGRLIVWSHEHYSAEGQLHAWAPVISR